MDTISVIITRELWDLLLRGGKAAGRTEVHVVNAILKDLAFRNGKTVVDVKRRGTDVGESNVWIGGDVVYKFETAKGKQDEPGEPGEPDDYDEYDDLGGYAWVRGGPKGCL